jgi:hypothetical protein
MEIDSVAMAEPVWEAYRMSSLHWRTFALGVFLVGALILPAPASSAALASSRGSVRGGSGVVPASEREVRHTVPEVVPEGGRRRDRWTAAT